MHLSERAPLPPDKVGVGFRIENSEHALLNAGTRTGRWLEVQLDSGADTPPVEAHAVVAGWHFLFWAGPNGQRRTDNPLVLAGVADHQTWTAVFWPAAPSQNGVVHVRQDSTGDGSSWENATGDLQAAIEGASLIGGGQVWVADGTYRPVVFWRGDPRLERQDAFAVAERAMGRSLTPSEVSAYWTGRALDYIRSQPADWLALLLRKAFLTLNSAEMVDSKDQYSHADLSSVLRAAGWVFHFGLLAPLALLGVLVSWPERRRLIEETDARYRELGSSR